MFTKVKSPPKQALQIKQFYGADLRNAPSNVSVGRSPECPNMIRDTVGNVRKRNGYETLLTLEAPINGGHILRGQTDVKLVHAKDKLYEVDLDNKTSNEISSDMSDSVSSSVQIGGKLFICDGENFLSYDGTLEEVTDNAYIPTTIIARLYDGGGEILEPVNLLQPKRTERFTGDNTHTTFQLSTDDIDVDEVIIKSLQNDGTFSDLVEDTDFTVNRALGTFTLNSAKLTPIVGEDNLYVTYSKTIDGYQDKVKKCDVMKLYGMNGQRDILLLTGNPDQRNYIWYSRGNNPYYFGDTWYATVGQDNAEIVNFSIVNDNLVVHKNSPDTDSTTIMTFDYIQNQVVLRSKGSFQATGALAKHSFAAFDNEPLYVTVNSDISAITPSDILGERFSQERSYFITPALAKETDLKYSYGIIYDRYYVLACGDRLYLMDSTQPIYEKDTPYSNRQYECYYFTGINANVLWNYNGDLYFGTKDGKVKVFNNSYTDDGENFDCYFDTHEIYGTHPELKKMFTHLAVLLASHPHTGCRIWFKVDGLWEQFFDYDESANFLDFSDIDFDEWTFRTDDTPTLAGGKMKIKKVLHTQIRFENSENQPFGMYLAVLKFSESNEYIK